MEWLNWYDLITPTNPFAAIFFGFVGTILVAILMWFEIKERKAVIITLIVGWSVTLIVVALLYFVIGIY